MKCVTPAIGMFVALTCAALADGQGILIRPDADGQFEYVDDFTTPKFVKDAFTSNLSKDSWRKGSIVNAGPNEGRTLIYRFYGDRSITGLDVRISQRAASSLGGSNRLSLSSNGLDWTMVADSGEQGNNGSWQGKPLTVPPEMAAKFVGLTKVNVWVRVVMTNTCGSKTSISNIINNVKVSLVLGAKADAAEDPQAAKRELWDKLTHTAGYMDISIDSSDRASQVGPRYYEDIDGLLYPPGGNRHLATDRTAGFDIHFTYRKDARSPVAMAVFAKTAKTNGPLMAKITVHSGRLASRKMKVLWDGKVLAIFDIADFFDARKSFFVEIPGPQTDAVHELRIAAGDYRLIRVKKITIIGKGSLQLVERPRLPAGGSLEVLSAYYMPDPRPVADSVAIQSHLLPLYERHAEFGGVRVVLMNRGPVAVRIDQTLLLNGRPIEQSYVKFGGPWAARGVVWYRLRPRLIGPGRCAQLYIRFRRRPAGRHAEITIPLTNGEPVRVKIPYDDPGLSIDYATTGKQADVLYIYARRSPGSTPGNITAVRLDGKIIEDAVIYGPDFPGNIALIVARLSEPLKLYAHHMVGVKTASGMAIDARFRVLPFFFPRNSIETPPRLLKRYHMNLAMWWDKGFATCEKYDIMTTRTWRENIMKIHPRVAYYIGVDEPDGLDNRWGRNGRGLGHYAREVAETGWQELLERNSPRVASWIMTAKSSRPLNWAVYGQLADVFSTDPYPLHENRPVEGDITFTRECLLQARRASAPHRFYATLEAFGFGGGSGVDKDDRPPLPAEYRQSAVQSIGCGIKGLLSWVYRAVDDGWEHDTVMGEEITNVNKLFEHIEDYLLIGTPIDLASNDAGLVPAGPAGNEKWRKDKVWTAAVLCGPDTIIVAAANHIRSSKSLPPKIEPAKNVTITVRLPDFLPKVDAFEATENGLVSFDCTVNGGKAYLKLASIESGRVFVLRKKEEQ